MDTTASRGQLPDTPMIDALEAVRRLTLERDALAQQVTYLTIQAADRERLAEQVRRLHTEVGGQVADLRIIAAERDTLAARVKRIQAHLNMLIKERDEAVLRANHAENALQAPERHERPETGEETGEGGNGAPRGCEGHLRACPECGGQVVVSWHPCGALFWGKCVDCWYHGPTAETPNEALAAHYLFFDKLQAWRQPKSGVVV